MSNDRKYPTVARCEAKRDAERKFAKSSSEKQSPLSQSVSFPRSAPSTTTRVARYSSVEGVDRANEVHLSDVDSIRAQNRVSHRHMEVDIRNHDLQQIIDIENGYSDDPKTVADHVMQLVDLGIAGIYIEDGLDAASLLALKIEANKDAVARSGPDLFVNARSDVLGAWLKRRS